MDGRWEKRKYRKGREGREGGGRAEDVEWRGAGEMGMLANASPLFASICSILFVRVLPRWLTLLQSCPDVTAELLDCNLLASEALWEGPPSPRLYLP